MDDDVAGDVAPLAPVRPKRARLNRQANVGAVGSWAVFLVIASSDGLWYKHFLPSKLQPFIDATRLPDLFPNGPVDLAVFGLPQLLGACLGRWRLEAGCGVDGGEGRAFLSLQRGIEPAGFIAYDVCPNWVFRLNEPQRIAATCPFEILRLAGNAIGSYAAAQNVQLNDFRQHARNFGATPDVVPVCLCPSLAFAVANRLWHVFHIVPFSSSLRFPWKSVLPRGPNPTTVRAFKQELLACPFVAPLQAIVHSRVLVDELPALLVLDWLDSSQFIKQVRFTSLAADKFAKLLSRHTVLTNCMEVMDELRKAPYNTLRKARIKADAVAMALWRKSFAAMVLACTSIHIFIDSSPQWKGFEFLATSFDCYHQGQYFARRLFPAVSLSRCLFTALGKTVSFLWQLFLLVGPSFPMLRAWLSRVIAMTTDMGVEAAIYKMPDILPAFCRYLNISVRDGTPGKWLFPNCIFIAGWRHRIDTLIMRGLSNLSFFPAFLENFKALISFLRENMAELLRDLRSRGLMGLAAIMDKASLPELEVGDPCEMLL